MGADSLKKSTETTPSVKESVAKRIVQETKQAEKLQPGDPKVKSAILRAQQATAKAGLKGFAEKYQGQLDKAAHQRANIQKTRLQPPAPIKKTPLKRDNTSLTSEPAPKESNHDWVWIVLIIGAVVALLIVALICALKNRSQPVLKPQRPRVLPQGPRVLHPRVYARRRPA